MKTHLVVALAFSSAWVSAQTTPGVLIVQLEDKAAIVTAAKRLFEKSPPPALPNRPPPKFDPVKLEADLTPVALVNIVAQEFDDEGRLTPIAWDMGDPVFRTAVEEKLIPDGRANPSMESVRAAMGKLRVGYLMALSAYVENGQLWTTATLFRGTREIWKDEVRTWQSQVQSQFDEENARRSIVRTWTQILGSGVLKDLPAKRRVPEPDPGVNAIPQVPTVSAPPPPRAVDNKQLMVEAMKLMSAKQVSEAINLLRDAVDAEPLDAERREALIAALGQAGEPALAAAEARRAAHLMPERIEFWVSAARAWLLAGNPAEALQDLNEAVARDPEGASTRLLLAEAQVAERRYRLALDHLDRSIEKSPTAYALRLRAFVRAAVGDAAGSAKDLEAALASKVEEPEVEARRRYRLCLTSSFASLEDSGTNVRNLIPRARLNAKDLDLKRQMEGIFAELGALAAFYAGPPPAAFANSSERLLLALNLLIQSAAGVQSALEKPNEDALTDAAIDLGEALKALQGAKEALAKEAG